MAARGNSTKNGHNGTMAMAIVETVATVVGAIMVMAMMAVAIRAKVATAATAITAKTGNSGKRVVAVTTAKNMHNGSQWQPGLNKYNGGCRPSKLEKEKRWS